MEERAKRSTMTVLHGDPELNVLERTWSEDLDIRLTDTCLRDGSHHKRHQFTAEEVRSVIAALDEAGVPVLEVTHGDGLGGSSFNYGFSHTPEQELIKIAAETAKQAKIAFLMLPGVGTKDDILRGPGQRRVDLPDRDALHRGRHLRAALRARAGAWASRRSAS